MFGPKVSRSKLVITVATVFLASGCTTVKIINPVATQNERNAVALKANAETLIALTDATLPALVEIGIVDSYRDTLLAIRNSKYRPTKKLKNEIEAEYAQNANSLKGDLTTLDSDLQPAQIEQYHRSYPLTAAIAFGQMSANQAASIWLGIEQAFQMAFSGTSSAKVFKIQMALISELPNIKSEEQAKQDILDAYKELRITILQQATNSRELAKQLCLASQTSTDPNAFLKGVLENDKVLELIGESVVQRTGDPERKKAANALLESLRGESGASETTNSGK